MHLARGNRNLEVFCKTCFTCLAMPYLPCIIDPALGAMAVSWLIYTCVDNCSPLSLSLSLSLMETLALVIAFPPLAWWSCCVLYLCMVRRLSEVVLSFTVSIYNFVWIHFICVQMEVWLWARFESCFPSPFPNFLRPWSFLIPFLPSLQLLFSSETRTSHAYSQSWRLSPNFQKWRFKMMGDERWFEITLVLTDGAIPPPSHRILLTYAHLHSPHPISLISLISYHSECILNWLLNREEKRKGEDKKNN